MNCIVMPYLDSFMIIFIDKILLYLRNRENHEHYLRSVLHTLRDHKNYAKFSKCGFYLESVTFLGHVLFNNGIMVDPTKTFAIHGWARPTSLTEVHSYIRLVGYYR